MAKHSINGIRIRLARHGLRHKPVYHIVAVEAGRARNALPLEKLGEYEPIPRVRNTDAIPSANRIFGTKLEEPPKEKVVSWDLGRIKWWIAQGANPTDRIVKLLDMAGAVDASVWKTNASVKALRNELRAKATMSPIQKMAARDTTEDKKAMLSRLEDKRFPVVDGAAAAVADSTSAPSSQA